MVLVLRRALLTRRTASTATLLPRRSATINWPSPYPEAAAKREINIAPASQQQSASMNKQASACECGMHPTSSSSSVLLQISLPDVCPTIASTAPRRRVILLTHYCRNALLTIPKFDIFLPQQHKSQATAATKSAAILKIFWSNNEEKRNIWANTIGRSSCDDHNAQYTLCSPDH